MGKQLGWMGEASEKINDHGGGWSAEDNLSKEVVNVSITHFTGYFCPLF